MCVWRYFSNASVCTAYPSAAVFQKNVDIVFVLEMMVKMYDVFVVETTVQLNFFVDLK